MATDGEGLTGGFLATEAQSGNQAIQRKKLIIPLVGDSPGEDDPRRRPLHEEHQAVLSAFYTSNVEMYLFQQGDDWKRFYSNVATLPTSPTQLHVFAQAAEGEAAGTQGTSRCVLKCGRRCRM